MVRELVRTKDGQDLIINNEPPFAYTQDIFTWRSSKYKVLSSTDSEATRLTIVEKL